ncbi:MAG: ferredoxin family protein [Ignavibacteriales bacterium]|nr:ferredoxin family protein [Ignavibacteriales bacterium]
MAKVKGDVIIDIDVCKGCHLCVEVCPSKTLAAGNKVNQKGYLYVIKVNDECTGCTNCATICPDGAITVYREKLNK